jgi:hypothetical protein
MFKEMSFFLACAILMYHYNSKRSYNPISILLQHVEDTMKRLAPFIVIVVVFTLGNWRILPDELVATEPSGPDPIIVEDLFNRMNNLRASRGLGAFQMNPALTAAAQYQAEWLVTTGIRTHFRPDGSRPSTRAADFGYVGEWCCGENYYMSIDATPDMVWNFWTWSHSHYVNLVLPRFDEVGIGMSILGQRKGYVLVFGVSLETDAPSRSESVSDVASREPAQQTGSTYHIVQNGETLWRIAQRYGVSIQALTIVNGISDPTLIFVGQWLIIPVDSDDTSAPPSSNWLEEPVTGVEVYANEDGVTVLVVDEKGERFPALFVSVADLNALPATPLENLLIASNDSGQVSLYKLTTEEYQINLGPDAEGNVLVKIFDALPPTAVYGYEFNVND